MSRSTTTARTLSPAEEHESDNKHSNSNNTCFSTELVERAGLEHRFPTTKEEVELAEQVLTDEFEKLSVEEHEQLLFDIHGLSTPDNQKEEKDPSDLASRIQQVRDEIHKLDCDKQPWEEACYYCGSSSSTDDNDVNGDNHIVMFLRCHDFDPVLAATSIVKSCACKSDMFGDGDILGRDLRWTDLTQEEQAFLEAGYLQVLPTRDMAGRTVVWTTGHSQQAVPFKSLCRASFYFYNCICTDGETQRNGMVIITYDLGKYAGKLLLSDLSIVQEMRHMKLEPPPLKMASHHYCMDNTIGSRAHEAGMRLFLDRDHRNRLRAHRGDVKDIMFQLQTFGIPIDEFPINENDAIDLKWHKQWLQTQKLHDAKLSTSGRRTILPRKFDVLFGRGQHHRTHTGNRRAIHLVEMYFDQYNCASKHKKTDVAERVVGIIYASHGRFLQWKETGWEETDFDTAREKISHSFRHQRTKQKRKKMDKIAK